MTTTIGHRPRSNTNTVPTAFLILGVLALVILVGSAVIRARDGSTGTGQVTPAPAAYTPSPADLFEQRLATTNPPAPAAYTPSPADLFEQRLAG